MSPVGAAGVDQWDVEHGWIIHHGGGYLPPFMDGMPPPFRYTRTVADLLSVLPHPEWQQWWSRSGLPPCDIFDWLYTPDTRIYVRRGSRTTTARIDRAVPGDPRQTLFHPDEDDAIDDVRKLMSKLQLRGSLPPHPPLGPVSKTTLTWTRFWSIVRDIEGLDETDLADAISAIADEYSLEQIRAFDTLLEEVLATVAPRAPLAQRCAVVLAGPESVRIVADDPGAVAGHPDDPEAMWILRIAPLAEQRLSGC